jgi:hypothetical protein
MIAYGSGKTAQPKVTPADVADRSGFSISEKIGCKIGPARPPG